MGKSLFWGALVSLVAIAAYFDARGITSLLDGALAAPAPALAQAPAPKGPSGPSCVDAPRDAATILARNPFEAAAAEHAEPPAPIDPRRAAPCDGLAVRVIAYADDPRGSLASIWDTRQERSLIRARGGDVNGQEVAFIGRDRVWLAKGTSYCQVEMYSPPPASAAVPVPVPSARAQASPSIARPLDPALAKQIQKRAVNDYAIDRGLVDRILEDPAELMKLAQTLPVKVDGQMVGVRLKGVRPESLLGAIGLQDGDVLERINGYDFTSPEAILGAYAHLRDAQTLSLLVTRGGRKTTIDYAIH